MDSSTPAHKIDAGRYRFLTFSLNVEPPNDIGLGSVARILWSSQMNPATGGLPAVTVYDRHAGVARPQHLHHRSRGAERNPNGGLIRR